MSENRKKKKQPYEKPDIKVIELVADEVLAIGCKNTTTGGKFATNCRDAFGTWCFQDGS